jgi:hypothetical protein
MLEEFNRLSRTGLFAIVVFAVQLPGQTVTETTLAPAGTSSLSSLASFAASSLPETPVQGRVMPPPRRTVPISPFSSFAMPGKQALTIPAPAGLTVTGPDPDFFGFRGLTTLTDATANGGFTFEPPDQGLAVGNGLVLEALNLQLAVFDAQSGQQLTPAVPLNAFFGLPPVFVPATKIFGPFISDPKCYFDRETQRWFITVLEIDTNPATGAVLGRSRLLIAVSQTANLLGVFNLFAIETTDDGSNKTQIHPGCPCFGDQPLIGADRFGFYISTNEFSIFGDNFNGANIYAMSKQNLAAGALTTVLHFSGIPLAEGLAYSVQPATSPDFIGEPMSGVEYLMSSLDFDGTLDNRIAVWAFTNTRTLANPRPQVSLLSKVISSETYGPPPPAVQPDLNGFKLFNNDGKLEKIDSNDDRMNQTVFAAGKLWSAVDTVVGTSAAPRAGIAYFIVEPNVTGNKLTASIASQGYVAVNGNSTMFPSIGVNSVGQAVMVMTLVGPKGTPVFPQGFFPSVAYTPIGLHGPGNIRLAAPGMTPDDSFAVDEKGVARWGDYTAAVADGGSIWIAGEWIPGGPRFTISNWGTFIGRVQ